MVSAVKMAENRDSVILRVYNPYDSDAQMKLDLLGRFGSAYRVNLAEEQQGRLPVRGGKISVPVPRKRSSPWNWFHPLRAKAEALEGGGFPRTPQSPMRPENLVMKRTEKSIRRWARRTFLAGRGMPVQQARFTENVPGGGRYAAQGVGPHVQRR